MESYRLIYRLITPVILGEYPVTLDALAYAALFARSADEEWARAQLPNYFKFTKGIAHASALAFGRTRQRSLVARSVPALGGLRSARDFNSAFIKPYGRDGTYSKVKTEGGPYRFRIDSYRGYWAPFICFDFCGDRERIEPLLDSFVIGIGARAQIGAGEVANPKFIPLDSDFSLFDENDEPARPLPATFYASHKGEWPQMLGLGCKQPPYWRRSDEEVTNPERVRVINL